MSKFFNSVFSLYHKFENGMVLTFIILLGLFPVLDTIAVNVLKSGFPNATPYTQHLVVIVAFVCAMITSRKQDHLNLSLNLGIKEPYLTWLHAGVRTLAAFMTTFFFWSAFSFVFTTFDPAQKVGIFPIRLIGMVMIVGYLVIALRFIVGIPKHHPWLRVMASLGMILASLLSFNGINDIWISLFGKSPAVFEQWSQLAQNSLAVIAVPVIIVLIGSMFLGTPIFVVLGGIAFLFFARQMAFIGAITNESYELLISHSIAAIPLFTAAGFILSESKAGERLVRFFRAVFGWIPGGLAAVTILVCAFFTTFTGASGVTILALGALLFYVLTNGNYDRKFSVGLLTGSGSVGLLFPPSLPIIIYGVIAGVNIKHLFVGGILPGLLLVLSMIIMSVVYAAKHKTERQPFVLKEALASAWGAIWELLLPVIIFGVYMGGITTIVGSAAIAVIYALLVEVFIRKDLKVRDLAGVFLKGAPIIGGVLIILTLAKALSSYIILAEVPMKLAAWTQANIGSKYVFLLLVNILLLITGCLLDIFSAIMVVAPLIIPVAATYGIHPVHLGIVFLANMELGYLTPPVGMNLFLASYRFNEPMSKIYRDVFPFLLIQLIAVLLITYLPFLSTVLIPLVK
ncbi:MAG: TRAP transporter large permease [Candidatus Omnitrophota bacterium]